MKKIIYSYILIITLLFPSCLTSGLDELAMYEDANITSVSAVIYRYISEDISPASGQKIVKNVNLTFTSEIDIESKYVKISVVTPENFPKSELESLSKSNLLVAVGVSTAARLSPINNSPLLGVPGDWSKPNKYKVAAANGDYKEWTIEIINLSK